VDDPTRVIPIFFPFKSTIRFMSDFAMSENTCRFVAPATRAKFAPFRFACAALEPSINEKAISPARIA
jgi:hypothetical protein